jgi:hypothetical protein
MNTIGLSLVLFVEECGHGIVAFLVVVRFILLLVGMTVAGLIKILLKAMDGPENTRITLLDFIKEFNQGACSTF